jgi:hypothetical protein
VWIAAAASVALWVATYVIRPNMEASFFTQAQAAKLTTEMADHALRIALLEDRYKAIVSALGKIECKIYGTCADDKPRPPKP